MGLVSIGRIYFPEQPSCVGKPDCMCDMLLAFLGTKVLFLSLLFQHQIFG